MMFSSNSIGLLLLTLVKQVFKQRVMKSVPPKDLMKTYGEAIGTHSMIVCINLKQR